MTPWNPGKLNNCLLSNHYLITQKLDWQQYVAESLYENIPLTEMLSIVRTLIEDRPLKLLLNLLFYHFNRSEPTYKSQRIKLLDVIAACSRLNMNALN